MVSPKWTPTLTFKSLSSYMDSWNLLAHVAASTAELKLEREPSPVLFTYVPLCLAIRGFSTDSFLFRRLIATASSLDICAVYPAISVNIIAASFLSIGIG